MGSSNLNIPDKLKKSSGADSDYVYMNGKYTRGGELRDVMYHYPGCSDYNEDVASRGIHVIGYRFIDYDIDAYTPPADLKGYLTYTSGGIEHPTDAELTGDWIPDGCNPLGQQVYFYLRPGAGCYDCVVSQNKLDFSIDDLLAFRTSVVLGTGETHNISNEVRQAYMRALARERGAKARFTHDVSGNKVFGSYQSG